MVEQRLEAVPARLRDVSGEATEGNNVGRIAGGCPAYLSEGGSIDLHERRAGVEGDVEVAVRPERDPVRLPLEMQEAEDARRLGASLT